MYTFKSLNLKGGITVRIFYWDFRLQEEYLGTSSFRKKLLLYFASTATIYDQVFIV